MESRDMIWETIRSVEGDYKIVNILRHILQNHYTCRCLILYLYSFFYSFFPERCHCTQVPLFRRETPHYFISCICIGKIKYTRRRPMQTWLSQFLFWPMPNLWPFLVHQFHSPSIKIPFAQGPSPGFLALQLTILTLFAVTD